MNRVMDRGMRPLFYAVTSGSYSTVKLLIDKGADVNAKVDDGATAIRAAKKLDDERIVKLLRARGATEGWSEFLD